MSTPQVITDMVSKIVLLRARLLHIAKLLGYETALPMRNKHNLAAPEFLDIETEECIAIATQIVRAEEKKQEGKNGRKAQN